MSFDSPEINWVAAAPVVIVLVAGVLGVLVEAFVRRASLRAVIQPALGVGAVAVAATVAIVQWATLEGNGGSIQTFMFTVDRQSLAWQVMIAIFGVLGLLLFAARSRDGEEAFTNLGSAAPGSAEEDIARKKGMILTEVFPLGLFAIGGMMLFATTVDLIAMFVVLEVFSLPLYILVALARRRRMLSHEASLKYFLLGAFSSAFFLFGAALVFAATGSTVLQGISIATNVLTGRDPLLLVGVIMVIVGLLFKLGAVPFHAWTPDAYQAAPTPVTAFMSAATKAAAAAALIRVLYTIGGQLRWELTPVLWTVAIVTMLVGTVVAVVQTDIKRMLAYSSISHAGFLLVALSSFTKDALAAVPFYMLAYGLASIGAFAVVSQVREVTAEGSLGPEATRLGQWAGLGRRSPWHAAAFALFLLSFAGIPLTAGFIGKFVAFKAAVEAGAWPLVLVAVLASAAAAFFYVRVIVLMFLTEAPTDAAAAVTVDRSRLTGVVIAITAALTLLLGLVPHYLLVAAQDAAVLVVETR